MFSPLQHIALFMSSPLVHGAGCGLGLRESYFEVNRHASLGSLPMVLREAQAGTIRYQDGLPSSSVRLVSLLVIIIVEVLHY